MRWGLICSVRGDVSEETGAGVEFVREERKARVGKQKRKERKGRDWRARGG